MKKMLLLSIVYIKAFGGSYLGASRIKYDGSFMGIPFIEIKQLPYEDRLEYLNRIYSIPLSPTWREYLRIYLDDGKMFIQAEPSGTAYVIKYEDLSDAHKLVPILGPSLLDRLLTIPDARSVEPIRRTE